MSIEGIIFTISGQGCVYSGHPTQRRHPSRNRHRTEMLCTTAVVACESVMLLNKIASTELST